MLLAHSQSGAITLRAAIQRYFEVALYLLVLTGFGTLASTGGVDLPTMLLAGAAVLFRGYLLATRRTFLIPERWTTVLTVAYAGFYLLDYFFISGGFLNATIHLVIFAQVVRLFSARRERDYYFLAVIAFLMVLAAAVLTVGSMFLLTFSGFMLVAAVAVILMEMRHTAAKSTVHANESRDELAHRHMAFSLAGASPVLVLFILLGAAGIFFLLPRISAGYFSAYAPTSDLTTGFSDRVQLGQIGQIQQSNSVVMHIQIDGDTRGAYDLKWRGVALSRFDGHSWSNPLDQVPALHLPDGRFSLVPARPPWEQANEEPALPTVHSIHYRVMMEPVGTNVFFLASKPATLAGNYRVVMVDRAGAVYDRDLQRPISLYQADSNIAQPSAQQLRRASGTPPPSVSLNYLQLPSTLDIRVPGLAQQVTEAADDDYDKAVTIERYLMSNYGYTLQLPR